MSSHSPLAGRTALVTGASRGIGRATATALADAGADLVLLARSARELGAAAEDVRSRGRKAEVLRADLADPDGLPRVGREVLDLTGGVDILVNNAGTVGPLGPTKDIDPQDFLSTFVLDVAAVFTLTRALLPEMLRRGWGRVVNVSTGAVSRPDGMPGANAYVTSKAALEAHTLNLAAELEGTGVTVNAFRPGTVDTAMQAGIRAQDPALIGEALHSRFVTWHEEGHLITPGQSATALVGHLPGTGTGRILDVSAPAGG